MKRILPMAVVAVLVAFVGVMCVQAAEGDVKADVKKPLRAFGKVAKVEGQVVTVTVKKEGAESELALTVNDQTKIKLETGVMEKVEGSERAKPKMADGKLEDVKVGSMVRANYGEDKVATEIVVMKAHERKAAKTE